MRPALLTLLLAALPLLLAGYLSATSPPPTTAYSPACCTRYCTLHGCRHATRATSPAYFRLRPLYRLTIAALSAGGRARYAAVNVAFYLVFLPVLLIWLTYGVVRDAGTLRHPNRLARA